MKKPEKIHGHTPGPWAIGKHPTTVVTEHRIEVSNPRYYRNNDGGANDSEAYGGNLVGESILRKENAELIAAAPEMYEIILGLTLFEDKDELHYIVAKAHNLILELRDK